MELMNWTGFGTSKACFTLAFHPAPASKEGTSQCNNRMVFYKPPKRQACFLLVSPLDSGSGRQAYGSHVPTHHPWDKTWEHKQGSPR